MASRRKTKKADKKFMEQIMPGYRLYPGVGGHAAGMTPSQLRAYKKRLAARKNPGTKAERAVKAQKASAKRRVAVALENFLTKANPAGKYAGAKMQRNKGGSITIIPIKLRRAR